LLFRMMTVILTVNHSSRSSHMGHSKASKVRSHERIVGVAAARFRERGVEGVSVADLMAEAGLTHGGFYRHFASRGDLEAEGVGRALQDGGAAMDAVAESSPTPFTAVVEAYLSVTHRDHLATSCAVASLATDVARGTDRARSLYAAQVRRYIELLMRLLPPDAKSSRRASAIVILSTLVGAVSMARAVDDRAFSDEILAAAAGGLKERYRERESDRRRVLGS
jgi:TetR/AcrR family transcriptional regulator, transcriptional repressor for nem operon